MVVFCDVTVVNWDLSERFQLAMISFYGNEHKIGYFCEDWDLV